MGNLKRRLEIYEQIFQTYGPGESRCQISQLASLLHVSERHVQTLIKQLVAAGWIAWQASSGRNKKALLTCCIEPIHACYQSASLLADQGNVEPLLNILSFGGRDANVEFQSFLHYSSESRLRIAYLPFHRELEVLHPHHSQRRTERFLVTQICQRLTSIDQGRVVGDLSYHWQANDDASLWHFQIRNGVRFHDGTMLTAQDVTRCLNLLIQNTCWQASFSHIASVQTVAEDSIAIRLNQTDWHLPRLLARAEASIFKGSIFKASPSGRLMGSGAFSLDVFSSKMLRLNRNPYYSHALAILNRVELWVYPEWAKSKTCASNKISLEIQGQTRIIESDWRAIFLKIGKPEIANSSRYFTFEDTLECAKLFNDLSAMESHGEQVEYGDYRKVKEITLCSIIEENDAFSAWLSFLSRYPFASHNLTPELLGTIDLYLTHVRREKDFDKASAELVALHDWLCEQGIMRELKHEAFTLEVSERLNGSIVNGYGWCELSHLWIADSYAFTFGN